MTVIKTTYFNVESFTTVIKTWKLLFIKIKTTKQLFNFILKIANAFLVKTKTINPIMFDDKYGVVCSDANNCIKWKVSGCVSTCLITFKA